MRVALFGHPLGHSRSEALFTALAGAGGPRVDYRPVDVTPGRFPAIVERLRAGDWDGANVTIPFKEEAAALADVVDPFAARAHAANVLVRRADGLLAAFNTDGAGFLAPLAVLDPAFDPGEAPAVVFGAGGAARAVAVALAERGAPVTLVCRSRARVPDLGAGLGVIEWTDVHLAPAIEDAGLVVQATSLGMAPRVDEMPPVPAGAIRRGQRVVDVVYNPWETRFLREARAAGATALNGWPMLVEQAALSLALWSGTPGVSLAAAARSIESRDPLRAG